MPLVDTINAAIKTAMLAREKDKLEALRAVKAAILVAQTEKGATGELTQEAETKLLQRLIKQRTEAAEIYTTQNRADLADAELFQSQVISNYLPAQLSEEELIAALQPIIAASQITSSKDAGKVMGIASKQLAGKADNKRIMEILKKLLPDA